LVAGSAQLGYLFQLLLQYGADISAKDCDGMTPAMWASYFNKPENLKVVRNALERMDPRPDAILDEQDNMGRTVLHWAAMTCDQNNNMSCLKVAHTCLIYSS
jgi:ankyrin repeat protein